MVVTLSFLDINFEPLKVVLDYNSLIWNESYYTIGRYEIQLTALSNEVIKQAKYVIKSDSDYIGIIQDYTLSDVIIIKGFFLEHILNTRFSFESKNYTGNAETVIRNMVYDNAMLGDKAIERFILAPTSTDLGTNISINTLGKSMWQLIEPILLEQGLSIKCYFNFDTKLIEFSVWKGKNKTFSDPDLDTGPIQLSKSIFNVVKEIYKIESYNVKNYAFVAGAGEGEARVKVIVDQTNGQPKNELYVDARDLQPTAGQTNEQYIEVLKERGRQKLAEFNEIQTIDVNIDFTVVDVDIGDIVTYVNNVYDVIAEGQVTEVQFAYSTNRLEKKVIIGRERINILQRIRRDFT